MHRLFGKPKPKVEAPTLDQTSTALSGRLKDIDTKIAELDLELKKYSEQLKKCGNTPAAANIKRRAMEVLKRKRMYETQRDSLANQQFNMDQTAFAINTVKDTQTTVAAMKAAAKTLKTENKKIDLNDLENMQDDMEDMLEDVGEIQDILGRSYGMPDGVDEADLDAELAFLGDQFESESLALDEPAAAVSTGAAAEPSTVFTSLPAPGFASTLPAAASTAPKQGNALPVTSNFNII